jgi:hypothetical protein
MKSNKWKLLIAILADFLSLALLIIALTISEETVYELDSGLDITLFTTQAICYLLIFWFSLNIVSLCYLAFRGILYFIPRLKSLIYS